MPLRDYRELTVWQAAMELAERIYALTTCFPKTEQFGLSSQIQRAAVSVPSNIAEGHARDSTKEYLRFISVSMGSLAELETQLLLAQRLNYLQPGEIAGTMELAAEVGRMLRGLQKSPRSKLAPSP
jgi:S23 ribosomal protein.